MPRTECKTCSGTYYWIWEEAFDKFGFRDGDGQVETHRVEAVLREAGYETVSEMWGAHNTTIDSIKKDGKELIPEDTFEIGYDDPRDYLPEEVIDLLDDKLST